MKQGTSPHTTKPCSRAPLGKLIIAKQIRKCDV